MLQYETNFPGNTVTEQRLCWLYRWMDCLLPCWPCWCCCCCCCVSWSCVVVVVVVVWVIVVLLWNPDWHRWMCYSPLIVVVHVSCWQLPSFSFASSTVVGLIGNSLQPVEPVTQNKIYYKLVLSLVYFKLAQLQKSQHFPSYQQQILPCFVKAGCSASCSWMGLKNGT